MSIFSNIMGKIFPASHTSVGAARTEPAPINPTSAAGVNSSTEPASPASSAATVDVEGILNGMARQDKQNLNWRTSIVDLMKLLGLDSGLEPRRALAQELHYTGDTNDSASMNIWLHKQVMTKLAENGGKVPADLKS